MSSKSRRMLKHSGFVSLVHYSPAAKVLKEDLFACAAKAQHLSGSLNGSGRSRTLLTTLKIAVLAPIPSASVKTAIAVNPGRFAKILQP